LKRLFVAASIITGCCVGSYAATKKAVEPLPAPQPLATASIQCSVSGSTIAGANNSRTLTISDADLQTTLNWVKDTQLQLIANQFNGGITVGFNPTVPQIEWGWFQVSIVNGTIAAVQVHNTTPAQQPPPIGLQ
jgi:PBP1b-binding outer membrane lipoprotein LpoB